MSITVKQLKEALTKFRDDAVCYAYEGEVCGVVISPPGESGGPGVIHCSEGAPEELHIDIYPSVAADNGSESPEPRR